MKTYALGGWDGIGYRVSEGIGAIDIDHCIREDGSLNDVAASVMSFFPDAYFERSPSGTGLRGFFRLSPDFAYDKTVYYINNRKHGLEVYLPGATNRFVTVTGDVFRPGTVDPLYAGPDIGILVKEQSPDIALGVDKGGAGDQGMMYGYATNETAELLPIPFVAATRFLEILRNHPSKMFRADAKAQVSFDYDSGKITTFLCSVQHSPNVEPSDFRHIVEGIMVLAACENGLNTDFEKLVNPTGRFVIGGSFADCGVTGRKLACDTYGGVGHIGGGAMSGKDPSKVDRSGAYAARKIAVDIVRAGYADKAEVQIAYAIGVADPVSVYVETFGTEHQDRRFIEQYVRENYNLTPRGIIESLHLLDVDYNEVSAYGHFGKKGLPWEQ